MDYQAVFAVTANIKARRQMRDYPWRFGSVPFVMSDLAPEPMRERTTDEVGCCVVGGQFYLGLFRRDGSAAIAAMPDWMADGLAHFIHFDLLGMAR